MNKFLLFFKKRLLPTFLVILYAGVSVAIASAAAYKLSQPLLQTKQEQINSTFPTNIEADAEPMNSKEISNSANPLTDIDFIENSPEVLNAASAEDENQSALSQNSPAQSLSNFQQNNNQNNNRTTIGNDNSTSAKWEEEDDRNDFSGFDDDFDDD